MKAATGWVRNPQVDQLMIWAWVPFAATALVLGANGGVVAFAAMVFIFSFSHQTLTLPLVYADKAVFATHRLLFTIGPFVAALVVMTLQVYSLVLLAVIAAAWNAEHTLMQRFGVIRIYGRKAGQNRPGVEQPLIFAWFVVTILFIGARGAGSALSSLGMSAINEQAVQFLEDARPIATVALIPALVVAVALTVVWFRQERARATRSPGKHLYMASTAMMFGLGAFNPIAGFLGFMGSHAFEYYFIVDRTLEGRFQGPDARPSPISTALRSPLGRIGTIGLYVLAVVGFVYGWLQFGFLLVYGTTALTIGGLHFLYDTFIWKLRQPDNQKALAINASAAPSVTTPV